MCPPYFKKFARTRWFGKEEALDQVGLMQHFHGCFSQVWSNWCAMVEARQKKKRLAEVTRTQPNSPASMILKNPKLELVRISTRRTINQSENIKPMIRNNDTK